MFYTVIVLLSTVGAQTVVFWKVYHPLPFNLNRNLNTKKFEIWTLVYLSGPAVLEDVKK